MAIEFRCRNCGKTYRVRDDAAGRMGKCMECGTAMRVPSLDVSVESDRAALESELLEPVPERAFSSPWTVPRYKTCPFCAGQILAEAIKCKHCSSMLDARPVGAVVRGARCRDEPQSSGYGGIGRLVYFLGSVGIGMFNGMCRARLHHGVPEEEALLHLILSLVGLGLVLILVIARLRNLGMSSWWVVAVFVPLLNLWIGIRCMICPEGYHDTETLDTAGKILGGFLLVCLVVIAVLVATTAF